MPNITTTYNYTDESGELIYQVVRYEPKKFLQRRPDGKGGWTWNLKDVRRILYRLPELLNADKDAWVFIVEGEKDADRLYSIGLCATTCAMGSSAWIDNYSEFLNNRKVCVLPDNDDVGRKHAQAIVDSIAKAGGKSRILNLPDLPAKGDISDWLDNLSGTKEELQTFADSVQVAKSKRIITLKDDSPDTVAIAFEKQSPVSHHYNSIDGWSIYSNNQYQQVKDENELILHVRKFVKKCKTKKRLKQTNGFIKDVLSALAAMSKVHILPAKKAVCSFNNALNPNTTIALKNGLLDLSDMKKPVVKPFTPDFYTFNYLPVAYDPAETAPRWLGALGYYFTEDDVSKPDLIARDVIHSWQKRFLMRYVNPHKIFALIGDPRSGKGTIGRITCRLIGMSNMTSITIASLAGPHGLHCLMNKQLGVMWDASITGRSGDANKAVEVLKNISGQDNILINPKGKDMIELEALKLNILMIANEPADLKDNTGALASRLTFLKTTQSFIGHEDPSFEEYIIKHELSGILNLILAAPDTIIEHPNSEILCKEFREMSSPYAAFAEDCCTVGDSDMFIPVDILWAYYCDWCDKYNHRAPSAQTFKVKFLSAVRGVKRYRPRLTSGDVIGLENEHNLGTRPGSTLNLVQRPRCYRCIDINEGIKGIWRLQEGPDTGQGWSGF